MKKIVLSLCLIAVFVNAEMLRIGNKGIVLDTKTKLMWQNSRYTIDGRRTWNGAMDYCKNLSFAGFDDWILPQSHMIYGLYNNNQFLTTLDSDGYWSSSELVDGNAWAVDFSYRGTIDSKKNVGYYVRCARHSTSVPIAFSSFLEAISTAVIEKEKVVLHSSHDVMEEFLVIYNDKHYFGTKKEIFTQIGLKPAFSTLPFNDIRITTQGNLNKYLTIKKIPAPMLPAPLNLVKDEFESKAEFDERVKKENAVREAEIFRLQEKYHSDLEARNAELQSRKANINTKKKELLFQSLALTMGEPTLSNPIYDPETNIMLVDVSMSNAKWSVKVGITIADRNQAKAFKLGYLDAITSVTFVYENDAVVLNEVDINFDSLVYIVAPTEINSKPVPIVIVSKNL